MDTCIQTHRCNGSLAAHVSVRYVENEFSKQKMWIIRTFTFDVESKIVTAFTPTVCAEVIEYNG